MAVAARLVLIENSLTPQCEALGDMGILSALRSDCRDENAVDLGTT